MNVTNSGDKFILSALLNDVLVPNMSPLWIDRDCTGTCYNDISFIGNYTLSHSFLFLLFSYYFLRVFLCFVLCVLCIENRADWIVYKWEVRSCATNDGYGSSSTMQLYYDAIGTDGSVNHVWLTGLCYLLIFCFCFSFCFAQKQFASVNMLFFCLFLFIFDM